MRFDVDSRRFTLLVVGLIAVMMGMMSADTALDTGRARGEYDYLFVVGWLIIVVVLSLESSSLRFDMSKAVRAGIPALLILGAAIYAQRTITVSSSAFTTAAILFVGAWILLVMGVSWDKSTRTFDKKKLSLAGTGAALIVTGLVAVSYGRRYNFRTQSLDGPGNVYNPGLPLFAVGWIVFLFGASQK